MIYLNPRMAFVIFLSSTAFSAVTHATDYYLTKSGTPPAGLLAPVPLADIDAFNQKVFNAGDRVYFEGGKVFTGRLSIDSNDAGESGSLELGSYGTGRATISGNSSGGVLIYNKGNVWIHDLNFSGPGAKQPNGTGFSSGTGIDLLADRPPAGQAAPARFGPITIENVEVSKFGWHGIQVGSYMPQGLNVVVSNGISTKQVSGFQDVRISNAKLHDNTASGFNSYAYQTVQVCPTLDPSSCYTNWVLALGHSRVKIEKSWAYSNKGDPFYFSNHSGSGIVMAGVDDGTIEHSVAYGNGGYCHSEYGGPVGIWAWNANNIKIQHNESYSNVTGLAHKKGGSPTEFLTTYAKDGGGFDLDGGTTNSVMQYNYSHENYGAGFLICQFSGGTRMAYNTVRYNVSQNDGRKNGFGGIMFFSKNEQIDVYNNTVYVSPPSGAALRFTDWTGNDVRIRNNIFIASGNVALIKGRTRTGLFIQGNNYWAPSSSTKFLFDSVAYSSLSSFRGSTLHEKLNGIDVGSERYPWLKAEGTGGILNTTSSMGSRLTAYQLDPGSPLINAGINLSSTFGTAVGIQDFYGNFIPKGSSTDVGAYEAPSGVATVNINDNTLTTDTTVLRRFRYSGAWSYAALSGAYRSDNHYSNEAGASYEVQFYGSQVKLYSGLAYSHGIMAVSIDGGAETLIDLFSAAQVATNPTYRADNKLVFSSASLTPAVIHKIRVRVTGDKNPGSVSNWVPADRVEIVP